MRYLKDLLDKFRAASGGNTIMIFALSVLPILAVVGTALDLSRIQTARTQVNTLLDQAVLAASNLNYKDDPVVLVSDWMDSQITQFGYPVEDLTVATKANVALNSKTVAATATLKVDTAIMHMFGTDIVTIQVASEATQSIPNIEIAMVLDISSSMRGTRLQSLKTASTEFVDIMLTEKTKPSTSISVVPFGGSVNIGPSLFSKFAVQTTDFGTIVDPGLAQYNLGTNVETNAFRFTSGHNCVEAIQTDYDTAMVPSHSRPQLPDFWRWWNSHPWCPEDKSAVFLNSNDATAIKTHLNAMVLSDGTGMDIGTMWGLKFLSPAFRGELAGDFSDRPLDFSANETKKVMIVMTDGNITAQNRPEDISLGNVHTDRPTNNAPHVSPKSNQGNRANMQTTRSRGSASNLATQNTAVGRFKKACDAAKTEGIEVFTIGFQIKAGSLADQILQECATNPSYYYFVEGLDLTATFQSIAAKVNELRITR